MLQREYTFDLKPMDKKWCGVTGESVPDASPRSFYRVTNPKRPVICEQALSLAENLAVIPDGLASISTNS